MATITDDQRIEAEQAWFWNNVCLNCEHCSAWCRESGKLEGCLANMAEDPELRAEMEAGAEEMVEASAPTAA